MSKISDEVRKWCASENDTECGGFVTKVSFDELSTLADRIDAEMMELPRDRDGVPIHVGDTVYLDDGRKAEVTRIDLLWCTTNIVCWASGKDCDCLPSGISHTRPDSWERIADELEGLSVDSGDNYYVSTHCSKLADRIRKLAKEGEHE